MIMGDPQNVADGTVVGMWVRDIFIKFPRGGGGAFEILVLFLKQISDLLKKLWTFQYAAGFRGPVKRSTILYTPRASDVQISHKTSNKYLRNIQKSITELLHLAATTTRRIIVPHVTYKIVDLFGLSKFKGGGAMPPWPP